MDPYLRELCMEIVNQDVGSDKFVSLLIETGIRLESLEWDMANKILERGDEINAHVKNNNQSVH